MISIRSGISACALIGAASAPAVAQTAAGAAPAAVPAASDIAPPPAVNDAVGEIIVTAQKRSENLQKVPIAITALDSTTIARSGITSVSDIATRVPSLQVSQNAPTHTSYKIRGLGNEGDVLTFEPEVALFFDGAYRLKAVFGATELIDVQRIEVLKGPQSTLYGKNATAGVINVITAAPSPTLDAGGDFDISNYRARVRGFVNGGLADGVSARVSFFYVRGISPEQTDIGPAAAGNFAGNQWGIRPQLLLEPTDRLKIRLIGGYVYRHPRPINPTMLYSSVDAGVTSAVVANPKGLAAADPDHLTDGIINADARPFDPSVLAPGAERRDVTQYCTVCAWTTKIETAEATAIIDYDLGFATLTSITSYDNYHGRVTQNSGQGPLEMIFYDARDKSRSDSEELRLASSGNGPLQWLIGGYYYHNVLNDTTNFRSGAAIDEFGIAAFGTTRVFGLPGDTVTDYSENHDRLYSVFGNASYRLNDQFTVRGGLRYSYEEKAARTANAVSLNPNDLGGSIINFLTTQPFSIADSFKHLTGNVGIDFQLDPATLIYASASTAYKSGGFNVGFGAQATGAEYKPEKVKSAEVGIKTSLFDRRVRFTFDAFYTQLDNYQAASFQGFSYGVANGDATSKGVEAEVVARLGGGFEVDGSITYADAHYRRFVTGPCYAGNPNTTTNGNCDLSGRQLPYNAKVRGNLALSYQGSSGFYGRIDQFATTDYNANTSLDPRSVQSGFGLTNIRVGKRFGRFDLSAYVDDLFDKVYLAQQATAPAVIGPSLDAWLSGHREGGVTLRVSL